MYKPTKPLIAFFRNTSSVGYEKGEIIYRSDVKEASVFYLRSGYVKSYTIKENGDTSTLAYYGAHAVFPLRPVLKASGFSPVFTDGSEVYFETVSDAVLHKRRQADFIRYIEAQPILYRDVVYMLLDNLELYISRAEGMEFRYAKQRLAYQLLKLAAKFGNNHAKTVEIDLPLTHQELASSLDMARETVSREIESLKQEGYLHTIDGKIIILDTDGLADILQ